MGRWKKHIPEGVQDYLMEECFHKREIESKLRDFFYRWGYDEIETPTFEYYDVFSSGIGSVRQEQMLKFIDHHGRILVLRPDITMPIARLVATKLRDYPIPLRLCYLCNAFGYNATQAGNLREFTQAGIELLGLEGTEADAEVISLAIMALKDIGLSNFQIDIGQVDFFKGLMEEAGVTDDEAEEIRQYVDQKNMLAIDLLLKDSPISQHVKRKIMELPSLYGGPEVLENAQKMTENKRCKKAIDNIHQVYEILKDFGLKDYISIDLGMVQSIDYYSGIIFRGITSELGFPILAGGRYDQLVKEFGYDLPATGFAMGIKRLLMALERQGNLENMPGIDVLAGYHPEVRQKALSYIQDLRAKGKRVEVYLGKMDKTAFIRYASRKKIPKAILIGPPDCTIEVVMDT
ncbi:MAG: ATP phosphoribosyltransferase regulatory subunit [Clostridia bacterium]|jgi:ATP phosphoribosyltransferase regulatory subunit